MDAGQFVLRDTVSMKDVLEAITYNCSGSVLMVNDADVLVGVIADGDVRRAILQGAILQTPAMKFMNRNYRVLYEHEEEFARAAFSRHYEVNLLPVVDSGHVLQAVWQRVGVDFHYFEYRV